VREGIFRFGKDPTCVAPVQMDAIGLGSIIKSLMSILEHASQDRIPFDCEHLPTKGGKYRGVSPQSRRGIDHRSLDPTNRSCKRVTASTDGCQFRTNPLPGWVLDSAKLKPENHGFKDQARWNVDLVARHVREPSPIPRPNPPE